MKKSVFSLSNRCARAVFVLVLMVVIGIARAQMPATLTSLGGTAPVPGANDVFQLSITGQANMPDGLNYYTDNQSNHNAGEPGQTFTTGSGTAGYTLTSLAIKTGGGTTSGTATRVMLVPAV